MREIKPIILGLILILSSCSKDQIVEYSEPILTHTLKKVDSYEIEIDSITASNFFHYQYFKDQENEYFTMLNRITQEIQFYNLESKKIDFKIPLDIQGPESVGDLQGLHSGYHIHNLDSIFVLNRNSGEMYIVNRHSKKLTDFSIVEDKAKPSSVLGPFARPFIIDGKVYLLNNQSSIDYHKKNRKYRSDFASITNLNNLKKEYFLSYPDSYKRGKWGDFLHRKNWTINKDKQRVVVSYPIDPYVYEFNLEGRLLGKHMAGNSTLSTPKSMTKKQYSSMDEENKYFLAQDRYGIIFHDPIRKVYLRDSHTGIDMDNPRAKKIKSLRKIVLLDENIKKIGEVELPSFERLKFFFNDTGMHRILDSKNENILKFEIYELVEIE